MRCPPIDPPASQPASQPCMMRRRPRQASAAASSVGGVRLRRGNRRHQRDHAGRHLRHRLRPGRRAAQRPPDRDAWIQHHQAGGGGASYFADIPGGIFTPSLAIGAGLGEHLWQLTADPTDERVPVLVSIAAFLAEPITASAIVIVMEMTCSQNMMRHLLAAALLASSVARQFSLRPVYHAASRSFRREALSVEATASGQAARAWGGWP